MSKEILGVAASKGIAIAKVFKLVESAINFPNNNQIVVATEIDKLNKNIVKAKKDIEQLIKVAHEKMGPEKAAIFEAHLQILTDPMMISEIETKIKEEKLLAPLAVNQIANKYIDMFKNMEDPYFRERASDVKDVTTRLIKYLLDIPIIDLATINYPVIIVAEDLTPSQTAQLDPQYVKGFVCETGGRTSHAAIMARSLEIPAVLGTKKILDFVTHGENIIINGNEGVVILNPSNTEINENEKKIALFSAKMQEMQSYKNLPTVSADNYQKFVLEGNIGHPQDVNGVLKNGGEGIGLFRSEFLYMDNDHFPTEEEQFIAYKQVLESMSGKMVIIRTLDIGGDKKLSYFNFPNEMNPFLGYRAIRLCLDKVDIFRVQLRALLRASIYGKLGIMFPMIATIEEIKRAQAILNEEKEKLLAENYQISAELQVGMMVEIPVAAILIDKFMKYVDFVSIGTNDLIQYSIAVDRMSENISYLYQYYHPALLRLLKMIIDGAHKACKWAGMCGEMSGEPLAIPLLMGLHLDYFSMSASSILNTRRIISKLSVSEMEKLVEKALNCETQEEVIKLVTKNVGEIIS